MKKILTTEQIRLADQFTIENEPIASIDLMERVSVAFVSHLRPLISIKSKIQVVCGGGNNGGDGFAIARLLKSEGFEIDVCLIQHGSKLSDDCQTNLDRIGIDNVHIITNADALEISGDIVIDAILGSGLNRSVEGGLLEGVIKKINRSNVKVVSVDIPSGLFADDIELSGEIIKANQTISFQSPKLSFLIPESGSYVGEFIVADIGLDHEFVKSQDSPYALIEAKDVSVMLPKRNKFQHKGDFGRVQVFAGSLGKMGAAFLCSKAVLRTGAGLLTVHIPGCGYNILQSTLPEAMVTVDESKELISSGTVYETTNAVCIGPGIGTKKDTVSWLCNLLETVDVPMVLDADALNIISENKFLMDFIPEHSVLTPHVGEFHRLFGLCKNGKERIERMRSVAFDKKLVIILKGANSAVALPDGRVAFNSTGNVGMATGGSGDVLSGIITGLMAQGMNGQSAAIAGVFLHGMAGDLAEKKVGKMSLMASDLLFELPNAISNALETGFI